ncbi:MAG: pentapeptide repeat-containing protein [Lentimicrobium sp.]|jgi:uncharacterized protein YjbI with pentapeptide repeats|nr:pentapeptide repeat-containing protein [Lentimicrobium sp.]
MIFQKWRTVVFVLLLGFISGCCWHHTSTVHEQLFPDPPDTSHLLALPSSTTLEYRQKIIQEEALRPDGKKRLHGIEFVPRDYDDFRFQNLDDMQWTGKSVQYGDFRGVSLRTSNANEGNFSYSDFRLADLRWSSFNNASMRHCNFAQAILFRTAMNESILDFCDFRGANMFGVKGHRSSFRFADFSNALMKESDLTEADFAKSKALNVKFIITVFSGSRFDSADFSYSDFTGAGLEMCSFDYARLQNVSFKGAHLQEASFKNADLKNADFFAAELAETDFNCAINIPEDLLPFIDENGMGTGVVFSKNNGK